MCSARLRAASLILAAAIGASARPAAEQPVPSFPSGTELVEIEVVVTDSKGAPVRELRQPDFVLREDGQPQVITHFTLRTTRAAALPQPMSAPVSLADGPPTSVEVHPRHLVLAIDDLHLSGLHLLTAKRALREFVERKLEPGDEVALVTTSGQLGFLEQFTTDPSALHRGIERLSVRDRGDALTPGIVHLGLYQADLIERNDTEALQVAVRQALREDPMLPAAAAIVMVRAQARTILVQSAHSARTSLVSLESIVRRLEAMPGRKTLVLLSDGFYFGAGESFDLRAITAAATRAGVVIYAIDAHGLENRVEAADASVHRLDTTGATDRYRRMGLEAERNGMNALALDTGGLPLFNLDIARGIERVLEDTAVYYRLAYSPATSVRDGRFRKLDVRVPGRRGVRVRTHRGYFAPGAGAGKAAKRGRGRPAPALAEGVNPRLVEGLRSPVPRRDLALEMAAGFLDTAEDGPSLAVTLQADVAALRFEQVDGVRRVALDLAGLFVDESGKARAVFDDRREFELDDDAFARASRDGLSFTTQTPLEPGMYQVRVAAEAGDGRLGTASRWVRVPDLAKKVLVASDLFTSVGGELRPLYDGQRVARASESLDFVVFAYGAKGDAEVLTDVLFELQLYAGTKPVAAENPYNVVVAVGEPPQERVAFSRRLSLAALEPGDHTLRVLVTDRIARTTVERNVRLVVE